ncbi:NAD(P)-dependent dehydrogenase (short-subunit alcohol dehydrogenase family) [Nocardia transvalensis]|uniref:NAD(P)-dependent dehydrogenase (Short-subunit alcohol dehydrogenase family) n=1 Tax=Nocardia transvalensis TaxID=37333 RepID=A0A7W9UL12_9NOCA|nr:SDR family NAD(P)-dependent oxidoreductase [Nocardia transvalensis]MBB5917041.1 NAD(P)-dependent dehydrogenase (short-subunit alcohol dehydrogenase family) [Nocardia transvalensis]
MGVRGRDVDEGVILLLGGRSEIGLEIAERLAPGRAVILAARRSGDLAEPRRRVEAAGATAVHAIEFDADDLASHQPLLEKVTAEYGRIGVAVLAFGVLGDQAVAERDPEAAVAVLRTDFVAQVNVLTVLANTLRGQGGGQLVVFSSVAGFRVRRANYVYGSAKAGLDGFASGLADALHGSGVHLLLVRSGFVIGKMTEGMSPAPFPATPGQVADAVVTGLRRRARVTWAPGVMRLLYFVSRFVPQAVWRRLPR